MSQTCGGSESHGITSFVNTGPIIDSMMLIADNHWMTVRGRINLFDVWDLPDNGGHGEQAVKSVRQWSHVQPHVHQTKDNIFFGSLDCYTYGVPSLNRMGGEHVTPTPHIWEDWQIDILERYLPDYKSKKTVGAWVAIMGKVLTKFKGRSESGDGGGAKMRKQWFALKSRVRKPKEIKIRSMNWNFWTVAAVQKKLEIKDAQQMLSGDGEIKFGSFQVGLNSVLSNMGESEIEELKETARWWNLEGPPDEEKQRSTPYAHFLKSSKHWLFAASQWNFSRKPNHDSERWVENPPQLMLAGTTGHEAFSAISSSPFCPVVLASRSLADPECEDDKLRAYLNMILQFPVIQRLEAWVRRLRHHFTHAVDNAQAFKALRGDNFSLS
ncbi:uncharacterized protein LACBIDRAFT_331947 [Laccaria bicolor S238N-H82]|uniref:Predicted protein n=1 Tax=Laccaria bicolor (strain S238N-H82 / ATCC MYA-4686) TaxID=486041 RepID=B0DR47_LACBS|nr:uncharacterized protein LACBIDRAFT_331947 [Laccaria bicolor S238N-H82]EDR02935.1 predicted protein [Laccaria bicolor S238N-H82]|eukprot:XP_001886358.1 predicted protein [Laccaria bicolor S238N-H82]